MSVCIHTAQKITSWALKIIAFSLDFINISKEMDGLSATLSENGQYDLHASKCVCPIRISLQNAAQRREKTPSFQYMQMSNSIWELLVPITSACVSVSFCNAYLISYSGKSERENRFKLWTLFCWYSFHNTFKWNYYEPINCLRLIKSSSLTECSALPMGQCPKSIQPFSNMWSGSDECSSYANGTSEW